jgi:hypothetical protein
LDSATVHHLVAGLACARTRYVYGNLPGSGACGLLIAESISRHATLDPEICLASGSDPRDLHLTAGRLVSLPDGKTHLVGTAPLTIGRGPSSDIAVHSEDVSRGHAYLLRTPQGFLLVDSSLHGTYVNGERVQAHRLLADGDVVQVGNRSFRFDLRRLEPSPKA